MDNVIDMALLSIGQLAGEREQETKASEKVLWKAF
jgi:hypothetical protein